MIRNTMWVLRGELIIPEYGPERRLFKVVANLMEATEWDAFSGYVPDAFSKTSFVPSDTYILPVPV